MREGTGKVGEDREVDQLKKEDGLTEEGVENLSEDEKEEEEEGVDGIFTLKNIRSIFKSENESESESESESDEVCN